MPFIPLITPKRAPLFLSHFSSKLRERSSETEAAMRAILHLAIIRSFTLREALLFVILTAIMTGGLCAVTVLRRKKEFSERTEVTVMPGDTETKSLGGWDWIRAFFTRALCWSGSQRPETEGSGVGWRDMETAAAAAATTRVATTAGVRGASPVVMSPLWQRRILMGERCQMPRFSGLILYDEAGRAVRGNSVKQEKPAVAPATTLKDLL